LGAIKGKGVSFAFPSCRRAEPLALGANQARSYHAFFSGSVAPCVARSVLNDTIARFQQGLDSIVQLQNHFPEYNDIEVHAREV
jgi:hypothetical protein